jgi:hypothetical protein
MKKFKKLINYVFFIEKFNKNACKTTKTVLTNIQYIYIECYKILKI